MRTRGLLQWLGTLPLPLLGEQSSAELQLTVGALIVEEMRAAVEKHTGFRCSAGISHNKVGKMPPATSVCFFLFIFTYQPCIHVYTFV